MKVEAGWLYKGPRKKNPDDRIGGEFGRGHFVPVMDKDGVLCLVDSAVLRNHGRRPEQSATDAAIERCIELGESEHQWTISSIIGDYYQGGDYIYRPDVDGEFPDVFEPLCDLREVRGLKKDEDERWFDEDDKFRSVHLYREHGYSWTYGDIGVAIVRKDAKPVLGKQFDAAMYDWHPQYPDPSSWKFDAVRSCKSRMDGAGIGLSPVQQVKLACAEEQVELLSKWRDEHNAKCGEWNRRRRHAMIFEEGDAFEWNGELDGAPDWLFEALDAGDIEVEYEDERGKHLLLNKLSEEEAEELSSIASKADSVSVPPGGYCVYRIEECIDRDKDEWGWRYGVFEPEWRHE